MIKLLLVAALIGTSYSDDINFKCFKADSGATTDPESTQCTAAEIKCHGPFINIETGAKPYKYDCGACPGEDEGKTCLTCSTAECNTKVKEAEEYKCAAYEWDATLDPAAFKKKDTETKCYKVKGETGKCNGPADDATNDAGDKPYQMLKNGCGKCATEDAEDGCVTTDSAMGLSALLLPLVAVIYTLF